jgi:hypothetical protein
LSYNTNADRDDAPSSSGAPADTARWRERLQRGACVLPVEVDGMTFDLMERFGGLKDSKTGDRQAIATALGKLLRRALEAFLREEVASRR